MRASAARGGAAGDRSNFEVSPGLLQYQHAAVPRLDVRLLNENAEWCAARESGQVQDQYVGIPSSVFIIYNSDRIY